MRQPDELRHLTCAGCSYTPAHVEDLVTTIRSIRPLSFGSDASQAVPCFDHYDVAEMASLAYVVLRESDWDRIKRVVG